MLSLVWFKRDLRVFDHPALVLAAQQGAVLPVYIVEPDLWRQDDASQRQWAFVIECLTTLQSDLAALGQPLLLRTGDPVEVLARLQRRFRFDQILSHHEIGTGWTHARDQRVRAWTRERGLPWIEVAQSGVIPGAGDGWHAQRRAFNDAPLLDAPSLPPVAEASGAAPNARSIGLADDPCAFRQTGGRAAAEQALTGFLGTRGQNYRTAMASPASAERAGSRLSPFLAHGVLSARQVLAAVERARVEHRGEKGWPASLKSFDARLLARDRCLQALADAPGMDACALNPPMTAPRPPESDPDRLAAWSAGETGLPFVDASMRYLNATGWLNVPMRALLVSVAAHHLGLDWRTTGARLARKFTDYEPGIHWRQVQTLAGVSGARGPRIPCPLRQGRDLDPRGVFIRRWVPELVSVPDGFIHEPWKWPQARTLLGRRYPEPVIDPVSETRGARERFARMRRANGQDAEGLENGARHSAPVHRRRDPAQMVLDL